MHQVYCSMSKGTSLAKVTSNSDKIKPICSLSCYQLMASVKNVNLAIAHDGFLS